MGPLVVRLRWLLPAVAFIVLCPARAWAQVTPPLTTALYFKSEAGDSIGAGQEKTYTPADVTFTMSSTTNGVSGRVNDSPFTFWWDFHFTAPNGVPITPGVYNAARRWPFTAFNGLDFSGSGRGCGTSTGRFVVLEAEYGSGGTVLKFAADFEQHCEDADAGLFGAIRYNSTIATLTPFGGNFPSRTIAITTPAHGNISSSDPVLNCGTDAGATACTAVLGAAQQVTLLASPDPGYLFAGWTGECRGGTTTIVHVNGPKECGALFEPEISTDRTLLVFDSQAGDSAGGGKKQVYSPANSDIKVQLNSTGTALTFSVASVGATRDATWSIAMTSPRSQSLGVGTYEGALAFAGRQPGLQVNFCSGFGRFVIRELVIGAGNVVLSAAVDLESHCNGDAGFFAALRYHSTTSDVRPFGGVYPVYRLAISPPANGRIEGAGLACGSAGGACELNPPSPISVTLTAVADSGYVFAGWTGGACFGGSTVTLRVNSTRLCSAVFEPLVTSVPRTLAVLDYMAESRGTGTPAQTEGLSSLAGDWRAALSFDRRTLQFTVTSLDPSGFTSFRQFSFSAAIGQQLLTGGSYATVRFGFAIPSMNLDFFCNRTTGRFIVRDLVVGSDGSVQQAAVDFEQHCNDTDPAVFGTVRFNSALDASPFGGNYPRYRLAVTAPLHGRVTGAGLDCAAAQPRCQADFASAATVTITATPDSGYMLAGWTGACHGGETIVFRVNTVLQCDPIFEPVVLSGPRSLLKMVSQPGESVLQGRTEIYSAGNSRWDVFPSSGVSLDSLTFTVTGRVDADEARWSLTFRARSGAKLIPGTYSNASSSFSTTQPYLSVSGNGRSCSVTGSSFTIRELTIDANGQLHRAAIDFEQHCDTIASPALVGSIEYTAITDADRISLDKTALWFASTAMPDNSIGNTTAPQKIRLSQAPGSNVSWSVTTTSTWLRVSPSFGTGPATLTVTVRPGISGFGTFTDKLTVTAGNVALPPVIVTWTLLPEITSPAFGVLETPIAATQMSGAVAVTGWALDDVEVMQVQIWRQPHPADPPAAIFRGAGPQNGKVFIGDATFVDGARPDVEALYALPNRSRAGWGYMMLTRGMVWDNQGGFNLYAIAIDREGHSAQIGSVLTSINNALATKPFGTIDRPEPGAVVSGQYPNTGWVITPNSGATIPAGNVRVVIDGVFLPGVLSLASRSDLTATFPTMDAHEAGRGIFIDTTQYADGVHTIAWVATDNEGHADGIGSRFFRIANGGAASLAAAEHAASRAVPGISSEAIDAAPVAMSAVQVRHGFDAATPLETLQGSSDRFVVTGDEADRVELRLPSAAGIVYRGYLRALGELRPLPPGAALDPSTGSFTWQPGPGFIGDYDLVFVAEGRSGVVSRHEVRVTLVPKTK